MQINKHFLLALFYTSSLLAGPTNANTPLLSQQHTSVNSDSAENRPSFWQKYKPTNKVLTWTGCAGCACAVSAIIGVFSYALLTQEGCEIPFDRLNSPCTAKHNTGIWALSRCLQYQLNPDSLNISSCSPVCTMDCNSVIPTDYFDDVKLAGCDEEDDQLYMVCDTSLWHRIKQRFNGTNAHSFEVSEGIGVITAMKNWALAINPDEYQNVMQLGPKDAQEHGCEVYFDFVRCTVSDSEDTAADE